MEPRKVGAVHVDGVPCDVMTAEDPGGAWTALRLGDLILVRAVGDRQLEMALARSFVTPAKSAVYIFVTTPLTD